METTLLALMLLLLCAALALLWRIHRRLERLDEKIRSLAPLDFVPDRLQVLAKRIESLDLDPMHATMDALVERMQRIEDLASTAAAPATPEAPARRQVVRAVVVRGLRDEGFESVRILSEESELDAEEPEIQVQAVRRGVQCAGTVRMVNGGVLEHHLQPSYSAFP